MFHDNLDYELDAEIQSWGRGPYEVLEYSHGFQFIKADNLILRQLMSEIGCELSKNGAVGLKSAEKSRTRLVYHSKSHTREIFSIRCRITATMWGPKKDDSCCV